MHNPLAKPHTLGQWLLGSLSWVIACLAGWHACNAVVQKWTGVNNGPTVALALFSSFLVGHLLIGKKVIASGKALLDAASISPMVVVLLSHLWMLLLILFQVVCLLLIPLMCLFTSFPTGSKGFVDFG
jgi:hypothetical protein